MASSSPATCSLLNIASRAASTVSSAASAYTSRVRLIPCYTTTTTTFKGVGVRRGSLLPFPCSSPTRVFFSVRSPIWKCFSSSSSSVATDKEALDSSMDDVQRRLMFEDECILVDEKDHVIGHDSKYNCHLMEKIESENLLHRAFSIFLFNSKYELLLQQRSATKVTFPEVWTNTCCSHPLYRDSELIEENFLGVKNAAQRKLFDELGIPAEGLPTDKFIPLGRILYKAPSNGKWGEHELDYLLFIVVDVELNPNPDEVADVKYVNRDQLRELLRKAVAGEDGIKLSPWFKLVADNFLFKWWDHVEEGTLQEAADMKTIHKL